MKVLNIVGARPNFMKLAPLMKEFDKHTKINALIVHTGQHYDQNMSDSFFEDFKLPNPDYNLGVGSGTHASQTAKIMVEFEKVCLKEKPDMVLVFGDVNSTIACALVAKKLHIKVVHVEAGMRSFDRSMPEEINRVLTDHIADINFCSTEVAMKNLKNEGIHNGVMIGDLMYDTFLMFSKVLSGKFKILANLDIESKKYILLTLHRASNTDNKEILSIIVDSLCSLEESIIFPAHPRTLKMLKKFELLGKLSKNVTIIEPVSYIDMVQLLKQSKLLLTDSGGMQKEAYFARVPCVTLRDTTEWIETLGNGNVLCDDFDKLPSLIEKQLTSKLKFDKRFYGDGKTSEKIVKVLLR